MQTRLQYLRSTFGPHLHRLRLAKGLTQKELANIINVDHTYISKLESSILPPPSEDSVKALANVLGVDPLMFCHAAGIVPWEVAEVVLDMGEYRRLISAYGVKPRRKGVVN